MLSNIRYASTKPTSATSTNTKPAVAQNKSVKLLTCILAIFLEMKTESDKEPTIRATPSREAGPRTRKRGENQTKSYKHRGDQSCPIAQWTQAKITTATNLATGKRSKSKRALTYLSKAATRR